MADRPFCCTRCLRPAWLVVLLLSGVAWGDDVSSTVALRRPLGLCLTPAGELLTANRRGTITVIDPASRRVLHETKLGERLVDVAFHHPYVLAVDEAAHQLLVLTRDGSAFKEVTRVGVSPYPISVVSSPERDECYVASRWSRRLTIIDLSLDEPLATAEIDLPFAPREQCLLPDGNTLIVADAFGGKLGVIDAKRFKLINTRELAAHNIRGLALSDDATSLLVAHQTLDAREETTEGGVHWGGVLSNVIRTVPLDWIRSTEPLPARGMFFLGYPDRASGDPTDIVVTASGRQILTYAGTSELAISDEGANYFTPIAVGKRPTAIVLSHDEQTVYVANTLSDSISVVDVSTAKVSGEVPLGPMRELTSAERGEQLFFDSRLASDGWLSCHSCHTDGHTNGGLSDNLGDGSFGAPKRVLSLLGVGETGPWSWNGKTLSLEAQVRKSIELTMRGPKPTDQQVADLASYLRSLPPPPPAMTEEQRDDAALLHGRRVFEREGCGDCHQKRVLTSPDVYDVGLRDELGNKRFNPPSLRGVGHREKLFHDNRARGLHQVLRRYGHGLDEELNAHELSDLVSYLKSL